MRFLYQGSSALFCMLMWLAASTLPGYAQPTGDTAEKEAVVDLEAQSTCPISGKPVDKALFVEAHGYRIFAASAKSVDAIKADPQKAVRTLLLRGEAPEVLPIAKPQTNCPIMDDPINKNRYADANGYRVYVCCRPCITSVQADPEKAIYKIIKAGEIPEPHPVLMVQSHCPIDGKPINKAFRVETDNYRSVFGCSAACAAKIKADPQKSLERMLAYGEAPEQPAAKTKVSQADDSSK